MSLSFNISFLWPERTFELPLPGISWLEEFSAEECILFSNLVQTAVLRVLLRGQSKLACRVQLKRPRKKDLLHVQDALALRSSAAPVSEKLVRVPDSGLALGSGVQASVPVLLARVGEGDGLAFGNGVSNTVPRVLANCGSNDVGMGGGVSGTVPVELARTEETGVLFQPEVRRVFVSCAAPGLEESSISLSCSVREVKLYKYRLLSDLEGLRFEDFSGGVLRDLIFKEVD